MARDIAKTDEYAVSRKLRKKVRCSSPISSASCVWAVFDCEAHASARDEFHLAAAAQNLRKLAKLFPIHGAPQPT